MGTLLYSNKIRDPQSKSVKSHEDFLVCKQINNRWHIIQSDISARVAHRSKNILANYDLINGHITDARCYRVFRKGLNQIKETL